MVLVSYPSRGIQGGILGLGDKKLGFRQRPSQVFELCIALNFLW